MKRNDRRNRQLGFTLIEMMVGLAVASLVIMAAVAFAHDQIQAMGRGNQSLEMMQTGRAASELLTRDLINAGAGVGYAIGGDFGGLVMAASFGFGSVSDGQFHGNNNTVDSPALGHDVFGDDLMIRVTDNTGVSIVEGPWSLGDEMYRVCHPSYVSVGQKVVLQSEDRLSSRVKVVADFDPSSQENITCGECGHCDEFKLADAPTGQGFDGDPSAVDGTQEDASFLGGAIHTGFRNIVWFLVEGPDGFPQLRRAVDVDCDRDSSCGDLVADNVDSIHFQTYQWDFAADNWVVVAGPITDRSALRVDYEMVVRSRTIDEIPRQPIQLALDANLVPPAGSATSLKYKRMAFRGSVMLRNSVATARFN